MTPWKGVLNGTRVGPGCPQICTLPPHLCPVVMSEDCLTANVFAPRLVDIPSGGLPVMVFIHGGSFEFGLGGCDLYLSQNLAGDGKVVVVTFNYRLGALGWLYSGNGSVFGGNYGFYDQVALLQWVQRSIGAFGGDSRGRNISGRAALPSR